MGTLLVGTIPGLQSIGYMTQWGEGALALSTPSGLCRGLGPESSPVLPGSLLALYPLAHRVDATSANPDYKDESGEVLWGKQDFLF